MTSSSFGSFDYAMQSLVAGLRVIHIATFDLKTCSVGDKALSILKDPTMLDFDQIPVKDEKGRIVGVLNRNTESGARNVSDDMTPLDESLLISADAPLMSFIQVAGTSPFRLILDQDGINGIVTRSDLLKLPVRTLVFAFVAHLESAMNEAILYRYGTNIKWLELLSEGRRTKVMAKLRILKEERIEPALLELTDFCDKRTIIAKSFFFGKKFVTDAKELEVLRNTVVHAARFINDDVGAGQLVHQLATAQEWIVELRNIAKSGIRT
jgi:hypothetical protein